MSSYRFHLQAEEYFEAVKYYLTKASPLVAAAYVNEVEASIQAVLTTPTIWPVIDESQTRRFLLRRFPYAIYYRWKKKMTTSRFML